MNRSEIIAISEQCNAGILLDIIAPYKKSLYTYFKRYYCCEPVLVVTSVFNACAYGFIAPSNEYGEAVETYISGYVSQNEENIEAEREIIGANSRMLKDWL